MIDIIDWEHNNVLALELKDFWVVLLPTALLYSVFGPLIWGRVTLG